MITSKVYNQKGKEVGSVNLPDHVFGVPWNADLVHQVVTSMKTNARNPYAHTKTRGEVRGGGKKPWKQKGMGKARHGSTRSPIWVGGGVAHGPRNDKNFTRIVSRKMKAKALYTVLSQKLRDGEILFVDSFSFAAPKAKEGREALLSLGGVIGFEALMKKKTNAALFALDKSNENTLKSLRNFGNIELGEVRNINPISVLEKKILVLENPESAVNFLAEKLPVEKKVSMSKVKGTRTAVSSKVTESKVKKAKTTTRPKK